MVRDKVEQVMQKAILAFAKDEGKEATSISVFIHTKPTEENPELNPKYFYAVDGVPAKGEDGRVKDLQFARDILRKKMDLMGMGFLASQFLGKHFQKESESYNVNPRQLYVMISTQDEEAEKLNIALYKGNEELKQFELDEIFGE